MKLPNRQIYKAVESTRGVRQILQTPYLDTDASAVIATNGHILAYCPVELDEGDTSGPITAESIKAAIKQSPMTCRVDKMANIKANGSLILDNGASYPRETVGQYVDYKRVIPDKSQAEYVISLDAKLLKDLADAINTPGSSIVKIHIKDNTSAFYVESDKDSECYGVIMPCKV